MLYLQGHKEISADDRIHFEVTDDEVIMHCKAAKKSDEGKYAIVLKNLKGSDTANIEVTVNGK